VADHGVGDRAEAQESEHLVNQEAENRDDIEQHHDEPADEHGKRRMALRLACALRETSTADPREHHRLAEESGAQQAERDERDGGDPDHRDEQQHEEHGNDQHREQRRHDRHARPRLEGLDAAGEGVAEQEGEAEVKAEEHEGEAPCPSHPVRERERPPVEQAVPDPRMHPVETADRTADALHVAVHGRGGIPMHRAADGDRVVPDHRIGTELDISHHGDHIAAHFSVDVGVPEDRDRAVEHSAGHVRITQDRHGIAGLAPDARGAENRYDRVGVLALRQIRTAPEINHVVGTVPAMALRSGARRFIGILVLGARLCARRALGAILPVSRRRSIRDSARRSGRHRSLRGARLRQAEDERGQQH